MITRRRSPKAPLRNALEFSGLHQAGDAMPPTGMAVFKEFCSNP